MSFLNLSKLSKKTSLALAWLFLCTILSLTSGAAELETPFDIEADQLEVLQKEGRATFTGHVVATQKDLTLRCGKLLLLSQKAKAQNITEVVATENVHLTWQKDEAFGDKAVYNLPAQRITLTGDVTLTREGSTLKGNKLTYDLTTGKVKLVSNKGRVKAKIMPGQGTQ